MADPGGGRNFYVIWRHLLVLHLSEETFFDVLFRCRSMFVEWTRSARGKGYV